LDIAKHFHRFPTKIAILYELIWIKKSYGQLDVGKHIMNFQKGDVYLFGRDRASSKIQLTSKWVMDNKQD